MTATNQSPGFSSILCGAETVRSAFASYPPMALWWRGILWLHGKPLDTDITEDSRRKRVADGFAFYAWLYRSLALIFLLLTPVLYALDTTLHNRLSWYWSLASLLAAVYLWTVSGLGYGGAAAYRDQEPRSRVMLICFMAMVMVFLALFVAGASLFGHYTARLASVPNLLAATTVLTFGVGSYLIEIIYLAEH